MAVPTVSTLGCRALRGDSCLSVTATTESAPRVRLGGCHRTFARLLGATVSAAGDTGRAAIATVFLGANFGLVLVMTWVTAVG